MVVGIGGVSRSGKSSVAVLIKNIFEKRGESAVVLSQDDFVFPESQIPHIKNRIDWECPESIDFQRFKTAILSQKTHFNHVITEGLLNFYDTEIMALFDLKIFTQISKNTFLNRRALEQRWGFEPKWYIEYVWRSYLKYGRSILDDTQQDILVVSGEHSFNEELISNFLGL